jgi:predicted HTH transcriptional regulator
VGRWTTYRLKAARELPEQLEPATEEDRILAAAREEGSISNSQCQALLGVDENRAYYLLKKLTDAGCLKPQGKGKGRKYLPM